MVMSLRDYWVSPMRLVVVSLCTVARRGWGRRRGDWDNTYMGARKKLDSKNGGVLIPVDFDVAAKIYIYIL